MDRSDSPIIVALDYPDEKSAMDFVGQINPDLCALKIGNGMFTRLGPNFVRELVSKNFRVFLDLKFHDIPNTVFDACSAAAELGVWMVNVHVVGGVEMMRTARKAIDVFPVEKRPFLIGVTMLTSLDDHDLELMGMNDSVEDAVLRLAQLAKSCGLDGVVCSAKEAGMLKEKCGNDFILVTPGIRLQADASEDQKRIVTPEIALAAGVDYLVIGRSITQAKNPVSVLCKIKEIKR